MQNCISPFNFTFICFPKDPQGNFLLFQQKNFPHKNQLKWHLRKHQLKCHQQKWHPQKDQRTVTLIWLLMLSLLSVGKFYSSKAGKWFHFYQHLLLGLTKVERYVHFKEFIFLWLQGKIFLSESIKAALQIFTSPARVGWVTRFTDRWVNCCTIIHHHCCSCARLNNLIITPQPAASSYTALSSSHQPRCRSWSCGKCRWCLLAALWPRGTQWTSDQYCS